MHRVGKTILRKGIRLDNSGVADLGKWNRYTLDLATLIKAEPGAIYQVTLKIKKSCSAYVCDGGSNDELSTIESEEIQNEAEEGLQQFYSSVNNSLNEFKAMRLLPEKL